MGQILLTGKEVDYQVDYAFEHNKGIPIEVLLKPIIHSSNKAQLKKVVDYLEKRTAIRFQPEGESAVVIIVCDWQALFKESKK